MHLNRGVFWILRNVLYLPTRSPYVRGIPVSTAIPRIPCYPPTIALKTASKNALSRAQILINTPMVPRSSLPALIIRGRSQLRPRIPPEEKEKRRSLVKGLEGSPLCRRDLWALTPAPLIATCGSLFADRLRRVPACTEQSIRSARIRRIKMRSTRRAPP